MFLESQKQQKDRSDKRISLREETEINRKRHTHQEAAVSGPSSLIHPILDVIPQQSSRNNSALREKRRDKKQ